MKSKKGTAPICIPAHSLILISPFGGMADIEFVCDGRDTVAISMDVCLAKTLAASIEVAFEEWIPVEDGPPPVDPGSFHQHSEDVLVVMEPADGKRFVAIGRYSHKHAHWRIDGVAFGWKPTHWRPMVALPGDGR